MDTDIQSELEQLLKEITGSKQGTASYLGDGDTTFLPVVLEGEKATSFAVPTESYFNGKKSNRTAIQALVVKADDITGLAAGYDTHLTPLVVPRQLGEDLINLLMQGWKLTELKTNGTLVAGTPFVFNKSGKMKATRYRASTLPPNAKVNIPDTFSPMDVKLVDFAKDFAEWQATKDNPTTVEPAFTLA